MPLKPENQTERTRMRPVYKGNLNPQSRGTSSNLLPTWKEEELCLPCSGRKIQTPRDQKKDQETAKSHDTGAGPGQKEEGQEPVKGEMLQI